MESPAGGVERGGEAMTPDALSSASPVARELYKELMRDRYDALMRYLNV